MSAFLSVILVLGASHMWDKAPLRGWQGRNSLLNIKQGHERERCNSVAVCDELWLSPACGTDAIQVSLIDM